MQIRNSFVLGTLWGAKRNALVVGSSGAGKTVLAFSELARLPETHSQLVMNFSATTDSGTTQVRIEPPGLSRVGDPCSVSAPAEEYDTTLYCIYVPVDGNRMPRLSFSRDEAR